MPTARGPQAQPLDRIGAKHAAQQQATPATTDTSIVLTSQSGYAVSNSPLLDVRERRDRSPERRLPSRENSSSLRKLETR